MRKNKWNGWLLALAVMIGLALTGCGDSSSGNPWSLPGGDGGGDIPDTAKKSAAVTYISRDSSGTTYMLRIIPKAEANTSIDFGSGALFSVQQSDVAADSESAPYTPQKGDEYELTIIKSDGTSQISTGTVASTEEGSLSLQPRTVGSTPPAAFTVTVSSTDGGISKIKNSITITEGSKAGATVEVPSDGLSLTTLIPTVNQILYEKDGKTQVTGSGKVYILDKEFTAGTFNEGHLTVTLPVIPDAKLPTFEKVMDDAFTDTGKIWSTSGTPAESELRQIKCILGAPLCLQKGSNGELSFAFGKFEDTIKKEILYAYFAEAVTIDTNFSLSDWESPWHLKGDFKAGWNLTYFEIKEGYPTLMSMELEKVPTAGMKWIYEYD